MLKRNTLFFVFIFIGIILVKLLFSSTFNWFEIVSIAVLITLFRSLFEWIEQQENDL